jgi:23S rRNA pseudouridine1911/1915/1917 synthase
MPENARPVQSGSRRPPPEPEPIDLAILYQDAALLAIDKPPGMVVHPTYKNWSGTLLNGLLWHLRSETAAPRIVTRLDKGTSGLVVVALTPEIHSQIQRDIETRLVKKEYLAIVHGIPESPRGSIALPLARSAVDRRRVVVDPSGQESRTDYEVLGSANGRSVVRCNLVTGRTHQIRVHLAARGWPVVGDRVYGEPDPEIARQALHAWRVTLVHPISRQVLELTAPPPADLSGLFPNDLEPR